MFSNLSFGLKENNLDAVFGYVFFFVSDTAHSSWITGFNRLLLCSIAFQFLSSVQDLLLTLQTEGFNSKTLHSHFGNTILEIM